MATPKKSPRVLIVTPEVTYLPDRMGNLSHYLTAKAGGLADVSAALISALFKQGRIATDCLPAPPALQWSRVLVAGSRPR